MEYFDPDSLENNLIIYHVLIDRFSNSDPNRTSPYERPPFAKSIGAFHGGNIKGITEKLEDGWFAELGINALLISPPFEQIYGWIPGGQGEFQHYGYHGYFVNDFTVMDSSFGKISDLANLVEKAHAQGIAVILDVVINHPGYPELATLNSYGISAVKSGWQKATPENYYEYLDKQDDSISRWWGSEWIRSDLIGHDPGGDNDLTRTLFNLPDFKTESTNSVNLPKFLLKKDNTNAQPRLNSSVSDYLVSWISEWVRLTGIDGIRCDSAKHVDISTWKKLKSECENAAEVWEHNNSRKRPFSSKFFLIGEMFGHGIERTIYNTTIFDSTLNFSFQNDVGKNLSELYANYSASLKERDHHFISYISSHDTYLYDQNGSIDAAMALLLAPGGVLIFYGDETGRKPDGYVANDPSQATRSYMNWDSIDCDILAVFRKLGKFRNRHVAVSVGIHRNLCNNPYSFSRFHRESGDLVLIIVGCSAPTSLNVEDIFFDGEMLNDAFSGKKIVVNDGHILVQKSDLVLLERIQ